MAEPTEEIIASPPPTPAAPAEVDSTPPPRPPEKALADVVSREEASSPAPAARTREFRLIGNYKSVHEVLGGGKTADVLLWKDKKISVAVIVGATILWVLFEVIDYHLLTLVSHLLIGTLAILFLWSKATTFIKKSPPDIPEIVIPEDLVVNVARALRQDINRALCFVREIALGHDVMKFLVVIVALWILSAIGSCCDFLTFIYAAVLILHTVPILYYKYQDKVDHFTKRAHAELYKQYEVLDAKFLSKIPRGSMKAKKQH